jgi:GAF domain-containing protein
MSSFNVTPEMRVVLDDADRLRALYELALIDSDEEPVFNALTSLASKIVGTPISVMSMVGDEYQFFKSAYGMGDLRSTPLSHAFCKHVVVDDAPLIIEDARVDDVLHDNGAIKDMGVIGYLGFPLHIGSGKTLGSFCVVDNQPHKWSNDDIVVMRELAQMVTAEIDLRARALKGDITMEDLERAHQDIIAFVEAVPTNLSKAKIAAHIRAERERLFAVEMA